MDVGLPDIDGREAVRILRRNGFKAPIIMLTGHDTDSDTILGLESGANDDLLILGWHSRCGVMPSVRRPYGADDCLSPH